MAPLVAAALIQGGTGLLQAVNGIGQSAKAKKMAQANVRPEYKIQKPIVDNQNIAESRASEGISDASKAVYEKNADRTAASGIGAILMGGGNVNNIGDLYDKSISSTQQLALLDDEMRARNIANLIQQNNTMAAEQDKQWQLNVYDPYADKAQAAATLKKQGSDNLWKGINTVGSAAANYATGKMYEKEGNNVFPSSAENDKIDRELENINRRRQIGNLRTGNPAGSGFNPGSTVQSRFPGLSTFSPTDFVIPQ